MLRFDAYSATTQAAKAQDLVQLVADVVPFTSGWEMKMGKGFHTFAERIAFKGNDGTEFASVMWGGKQGDRCMIEVKGDHTPKAVEALRARYPHRCTRVDSCADFDAPRAFERLYRACKQVKKAHRIIGGKMGDWDDFPEKGRTLYLGATTSVTRLRLYEKGKQPGYAHLAKPNLARLEVQIRPAKEAKSTFAALSAEDVWGASRWTRDLAAMVLKEHVDPHPAGTVYRQSDLDRRLDWLCRQAGATFMELLEDCGTWENVGLTLGEAMRVRRRNDDGVSGS
jgi:DNA relaxase NicK